MISREKHRNIQAKTEMSAYTYMVECADGTLYTGWTNHLVKRMQAHNAGKGAKYTKSRLPVKLVYYERFPTKQEAMRREYAIKQLSKVDKKRLIENMDIATRENCVQCMDAVDRKDECDEGAVQKIL